MEKIDFTIVEWNENTEDTEVSRNIRKRVFIDEQAVPENEEWDEFDKDSSSVHMLARSVSGDAMAYLRIVYPEANKTKITRIAVLKEYRNQGVATALLHEALQLVLSRSFNDVYLHAQIDAIALYKKFGFEEEGVSFLEAGIVHQAMVLNTANAHTILNIYDNKVLRLNYPNEFTHHLKRCLQISRRSLLLCSKSLRKDIFADAAFVDALSAFARRDRNAKIHILVQEAKDLHERRTPLIELARKLPSKIEIRLLDRDAEPLDSFVCADKKHLVFFNDETQTNGFCAYRAGPESQSLIEKFEHAWLQLAQKDPNLSQLSL